MKTLFTSFLSVTISGSLILCLTMLLRWILTKAPKALICALWMAVFVRLLIPFQIRTPFSIRPETPVFSVASSYSAVQRADQVVEVTNNSLLLPAQYEKIAGVDGWEIASVIWLLGMLVLLSYTVVSYCRLRFRLRDAVRTEMGYYLSEKLSSAILLGYVKPRVYLPYGIEAENAKLILAHEQAHLHRCDNWLKLFCFIVLILHWYNPLVWVAYALLCRDMEDACDAYVIKNLDAEGKRRYSSALLSCSIRKYRFSVCPVAFGENSLKHRIRNVLTYRKPTLWITIVALVAIVAATVFFMSDPEQEQPPYYETLSGLLGKPMDTVFETLGVDESEAFSIGEGYYRLPIRVTYLGLPFQIELVSGRGGEPLSQFSYVAEYLPEDTNAEKDAVAISRYYWDTLGEGYQAANKQKKDILSYISKKTLRRNINDHRSEKVATPILQEEWDITDDNKAVLEKPFAELKESSYWDAMTHAKTDPNVTTIYELRQFLRFSVAYNYVTDLVQVKLTYIVRAVPESYPSYVYGYIERQTWWDKLWNWIK